MELFKKENGKMEKGMAKGHSQTRMAINMMGNGKMIENFLKGQ